MKIFITALSSIIIMALFTQCGSAQQFDKKAPFSISKAHYHDWIGGKAGSRGTIITLELTGSISDNVTVDSVFFKGKVSKLNLSSYEKKHSFTANFMTTVVTDQNIIMHVDPKKEMTNKVPEVPPSFPFELTDNECIISYFVKKKKHYYKVTNLKKEKPIYRP